MHSTPLGRITGYWWFARVGAGEKVGVKAVVVAWRLVAGIAPEKVAARKKTETLTKDSIIVSLRLILERWLKEDGKGFYRGEH